MRPNLAEACSAGELQLPIRVKLLSRCRIDLDQIGVPIKVKDGPWRAAPRRALSWDGLIGLCLIGSRINSRQHLAGFDVLTFAEIDGAQRSINQGMDRDHV